MSGDNFYFNVDFLLTFTCGEHAPFILLASIPNIMSLSSSCLSQVTVSFTLSLFNILVVFVFVYLSHPFFYLMIKPSLADSVCITTINKLSIR